jgi:CRISPR-associated DxTHG motif protein
MLRTVRTLVLAMLGAIALQCPAISNAQQVFPTFDQIDFIYAQDPQRFRDLWLAAQSQTVRIAVLGDSQEASPISHGFRYMPLLNYEMWKRFGNTPETPVEACVHFGGGSSPPGNWILSGRCAEPGPVASRLAATQILPSVRARAFSTLNSATNITGGNHGQLTMLQQDAVDVDPGTDIPTDVWYFNTSDVVKARIYAATNASSGEVAYQARPTATHQPVYSAAVTTRGTLNLGLQSATFAIKSGETSALDFGGKRYMALEVFGTSDAELTDIIGLRFFNETHPQGVVIDTFSLGGYGASTFLRLHADAGEMFRAFGFHAAILHYGANSDGRSTPEQFKSDISDIITRVRGWMGDPQFPVILIADVYQSQLTPEDLAENDQYVGAQVAIAQADSNVMVINARRLTEDLGWNPTSGQSDQFMEDGVHYTALGANVLSAQVAAAMFGEIHVSACPSDPGAVSLQSSMTLVVDLGGTSACTNYGRLSVAQALRLNQPALKVVLTNGFVPGAGNSFQILDFASASGSFSAVTLPALADGLSWNTSALYTEGKISVEAPAPPTPDPPTIAVTSGADQLVTLPAAPAPIAFTLSGSGALTVSARSGNQTLLPNSGISISSGCGVSTLSCTATLAIASGQTGSATVSLTVMDTHSQSAATTAMLQVAAASNPPPDPPPAPPPDPGTGAASSGGGAGGGGGSSDLLLLLLLSILLVAHGSARARIQR